jgi:hypothetical protein
MSIEPHTNLSDRHERRFCTGSPQRPEFASEFPTQIHHPPILDRLGVSMIGKVRDTLTCRGKDNVVAAMTGGSIHWFA